MQIPLSPQYLNTSDRGNHNMHYISNRIIINPMVKS